MPAPTSVDELAHLVRKSLLLEPAKFDAFLASHPHGFDTPAGLAYRLHADGLLTPFHTGQLLRGKHKGFFLGRYKILDRIGLGGMGQVFLAEHATMKRRAALKVLSPDRVDNAYSRERFLREARTAAKLDHPNLVRAFDFDQDGEVIFLVMEFVDGVSFHDLVARAGPLGPDRVGHYLHQAAAGLGYLHAYGLVHRDIKPANILVDRQGVVKILDLGLVRSEVDQDNLTRGEGVKILGTADFLAPEQAIDCSKVDVRADIYGLGATAYYLLTGRPPFGGDQIAQKLIAHQMKAVVPVHEVRPDVPAELSAVVTRMLAKKPADRYQTPAELMTALASWGARPPAAPTEEEIPAVSGGGHGHAAAVNLAGPRPSRSGASGSAISASQTNGSGSAIKYYSDSKLTAASQSAAAALAQPLSHAAADTPKPAATAFTPPPPKPLGAGYAPPPLPASATHGAKPSAAPAAPPFPARPPVEGPKLFETDDSPRPSAPRSARRVAVGVAVGVAVAAATWMVMVKTGFAAGSDPVPAAVAP